MRKLLGIIMIFIFVVPQVFAMGNVSAATGDISVKSYYVTDRQNNPISSISKDQEFKINLAFDTIPSVTGIDGIILDQDSSFYPSDGVYLDNTAINPANKVLVLKYKGTGKELNFTLKYTNGGSKTVALSLYVKEANPEDATKPAPVDTTKYKPVLNIVGDNDTPQGTAGEKMTITVPVNNSSSYAAKNVKVSLDASDLSRFPFNAGKMNFQKTIDQIGSNETKSVSFDLLVSETAVSGDYNLKFNFSYTNSYNDEMTGSDTIFVKIVNNNTAPRVVVSRVIISSQPVVPGSTVAATIVLKNTGTMKACDVKTTIKGLDNNTFTLSHTTDVQHLKDLKGSETVSAKYTLEASDNISTGRYPLSVRLDYSSSDGKTYSEDNQFYLRVEKPLQDEALLTMEPIEAPTDIIPAGSKFKIGVKISNLSKASAKNIKVLLSCDKEIIPKSLNTIVINSMEGKTEKNLEFDLSSVSDAASKNYPIGITLEYDSVHEGKTIRNSISGYAGVYIQSPEKKEAVKTVPRLIINSYNFGGSIKNAGETFDVLLSFMNTSRDIPIRNLKITFISDDGTFSIFGSNSFYIDYLDPKQSMEKSIKLSAKPDAAPKAYPLSINFEYEDKNGVQYTSKETISIPIGQDLRFVIGDLNTSPEAYAGQQAPLNLQFYNMGKTTLYNLMVKVEGDFDGQKPSYYVGNFEAGKSDSFDGAVTPKAPGQAKGSIVFTYEDASGKQTVVKKDFTLNVVQMQMPDKMEGMEQLNPEDQKKDSKKFLGPLSLLQVILIGAGLVAAIVVIVILRKRKKRKLEMMLDEIL